MPDSEEEVPFNTDHHQPVQQSSELILRPESKSSDHLLWDQFIQLDHSSEAYRRILAWCEDVIKPTMPPMQNSEFPKKNTWSASADLLVISPRLGFHQRRKQHERIGPAYCEA